MKEKRLRFKPDRVPRVVDCVFHVTCLEDDAPTVWRNLAHWYGTTDVPLVHPKRDTESKPYPIKPWMEDRLGTTEENNVQ